MQLWQEGRVAQASLEAKAKAVSNQKNKTHFIFSFPPPPFFLILSTRTNHFIKYDEDVLVSTPVQEKITLLGYINVWKQCYEQPTQQWFSQCKENLQWHKPCKNEQYFI